MLHITSFHYLLPLFFKIFLLLSEQGNTWLNKLKLQAVTFTRLSETINSSEGMCPFPTIKLHATTFSGAKYIQMLEAAQGSLRTIVTWKNRKTRMSLGFLEAAFGRIPLMLFISCFRKKFVVIIFKHLDQKTKFSILFPLLVTLYLLHCQ